MDLEYLIPSPEQAEELEQAVAFLAQVCWALLKRFLSRAVVEEGLEELDPDQYLAGQEAPVAMAGQHRAARSIARQQI